MVIEFIFEGEKIDIQYNGDEKLKDIFQEFSRMIDRNLNSLFFLYNGKKFDNEELIIEELLFGIDDINKTIVILVNEKNDDNDKSNDKKPSFIKSKNIMCPKCGEFAKIKVDSYKLIFYECKNGHSIDNIKLDCLKKYEFQKTQNIDISRIICAQCKTNKSQAYKNIFYRCNICKYNLCPICINEHDKAHKIINYDEKDYICEDHNEKYNSYCENCNKNLCLNCKNNHKYHKIKDFDEILKNHNILKDNNKLIENEKELRIMINKIKEIWENILNVFCKTMNNLENFYNFYKEVINNYDGKNIRYEIYNNIINLKNSSIIEDINCIINENHLDIQFSKILNMHYNMIKDNINEITLNYKVNKSDKKIKIFSQFFVDNNMDNCIMEIDGLKTKISSEYILENYSKELLTIKLIGVNDIINISAIFRNCTSLLSVPDFSKLNTSKFTDFSEMFSGCKSLESLPDISNWNTFNVRNMYSMFNNCESLESLPDISKWNTCNVNKMNEMFCECKNLKSLPDISKWNTSNVMDMNYMFYNCISLKEFPDIHKWNTSNLIYSFKMFYGCKVLAKNSGNFELGSTIANFFKRNIPSLNN